jgi:hypothetical protein
VEGDADVDVPLSRDEREQLFSLLDKLGVRAA